MRDIYILLIIFILLNSCCSSRKSISALKKKGVHVIRQTHALENSGGIDSLQIQYLGCGGLYIRTKDKGILLDPFFSNQSFMRIGKAIFVGGKIKSKPRNIEFGRQRIVQAFHITPQILQQQTVAIFNAHGHYDHLMDIPYLFHHWFDKNIDVYTNESARNSCAHVIDKNKLHDLESVMSVRETPGSSIDFPASDGYTIKVFPILAAHNPHAYNIKLFSGSVLYPAKDFRNPKDRTRISNWLEGRTLSFLIDIVKNDSIKFRMFIQSSTAHYPDGVPPKHLLDQKNVDVAILGVASYHYSEASFPCAYLTALRARRVMYIHWEDFFRSYTRRPRSVLKNDVVRFFKEIAPRCNPGEYLLPAPGVLINVRY